MLGRGSYRWLEYQPVAFMGWIDATSVDDNALGRYLPWGYSTRLGERGETSPNPALFLEFAALPIEERAIAAFARRYGRLAPGAAGAFWKTTMLGEYKGVEVENGDHFDTWADVIQLMREAVRLWAAIKETDLGVIGEMLELRDGEYAWRGVLRRLKLQEGFLCHPGNKAYGKTPPGFSFTSAAQQENGQPLHHYSPLEAARVALYRMVNAFLVDYTSVRFSKDGRLYIAPDPLWLLGTLWLQFAQAIDGNRIYRHCRAPGCPNWFEVGKGAGRKDKQTCSDVCRVTYNRKLKAERGASDE